MSTNDEINSILNGELAYLFSMPEKQPRLTSEERLIRSFNEITIFYRNAGRLPDVNSAKVTEVMLAKRLENIKSNQDQCEFLKDFDSEGLLVEDAPKTLDEILNDPNGYFGKLDGLLSVDKLPNSGRRIVENKYDNKAMRETCPNFERDYEQKFKDIRNSVAEGKNKLVDFIDVDQLKVGGFYVYDNVFCYLAEFGELEQKAGGYTQQRLTVIFEDGMLSHMYRRSLAQRLYEPGGAAVMPSEASLEAEKAHTAGYIYVLESLSEDEKIKTTNNLYKIGMVENESIDDRIANAKNDPTYLMADVRVVRRYRVDVFDTQQIEKIIHHFFDSAQLIFDVVDLNGNICHPREWYSVPIEAIDEAVRLLSEGKLQDYSYDKVNESIKAN